MTRLTLLSIAALIMLTMNVVAKGAEHDPLKPRVPSGRLKEVKNWTSPYGEVQSAPVEVVAAGKKLYEGKGTCIHCHGQSGKGDGPNGMLLTPSPRDFTDCEFQKVRSDGELFWVIKNGSAGTGMVPLIGSTINEDEAWTILAYERSFCKRYE